MAILRGEEARQWLAQNPTGMYTDLNTGRMFNAPTRAPEQPTQAGGSSPFLDLLLGISKPFRHGLGIAGEFGGTISDLVKTAKGDYGGVGSDIYRDLGDLLLTEDESKYIKEDPLQAGLKAGAGVLSYGLGGGPAKGVTAGARMLSAAGKGALASGVGGFGYSDEGEELESTLKGAASGAALGAAFQGLRELGTLKKAGKFKKGKTKPSFTTKELLGQEPGTISSVGGKENADRINEVFEDVARGDNSWLSPEGKKIKFKTTTPNQRLDTTGQIKSLVANYSDEVSQVLPGEISINKIVEGTAKDPMIKQANEMLAQKKGGYGWIQDINDKVDYILKENSTNGVMSVPQLNKAVQSIDDMAPTFSKLEQGGTQQLDYLKRIRNSIRGDLSTLAPALDYPKEIYSLLADATKPMERLASQSGRGARALGFELPLGEIIRAPIDAINRGANILRSEAGNIPVSAVSGIAGLGNTGFMQGSIPTSAMTNIGSQLGGLFSKEETEPEPQAGMSSLYGAMGAQQPQYTVYDAFAEAQQMMPNASISQLTTLAKMLLDENQTSLSQDDIAMQNVSSIIDEIESMTKDLGLAKTKAGASIGGAVRSGYGSVVRSSPEAIFKDTRRGLSSKLSRALGEVGVLTDPDIERAIGMIPTLSDTQESARDRLSRLRRLLSKMQAGSRQGYSQQEVYDDMGTGY